MGSTSARSKIKEQTTKKLLKTSFFFSGRPLERTFHEKSPQNVLQELPRDAQNTPRRPPGRSRSSPGDSRGGPGAPRETPKPPQETSRPPPERPKALQEASRAASGTLGGGAGCLRTSFWRFRTMFLLCYYIFCSVFPVRKIGTFTLLPSYLLLCFLLLDPKSS